MRYATLSLSALLLVFAAPKGFAAMCGESMVTNSCLRADNPVEACGELVRTTPSNAAARIALCEALALEGKVDEAEVVITQGISRCSGRACQTLRLALSYVEEKRAARERADPREAERKRLANRRFCLSPFNNERSVAACEALLLSTPKDLDVYTALINKLLQMGDASGALAYAIRGRETMGDASLFADLAEDAVQQRRAVVEDCLNDSSFDKCEQAYLAGAEDEYLILRREGELLTDAGQYAEAEEALRNAVMLKPADRDIQNALATLESVSNPAPVVADPMPTQERTQIASVPDPVVAEEAPTSQVKSASPQSNPVLLRNLISANGTSL